MKQYDFTSFNEMLNNFITPEELAKNIVQLLFNYASIVDEESLGQFKDDVGTAVHHTRGNNQNKIKI